MHYWNKRSLKKTSSIFAFTEIKFVQCYLCKLRIIWAPKLCFYALSHIFIIETTKFSAAAKDNILKIILTLNIINIFMFSFWIFLINRQYIAREPLMMNSNLRKCLKYYTCNFELIRVEVLLFNSTIIAVVTGNISRGEKKDVKLIKQIEKFLSSWVPY